MKEKTKLRVIQILCIISLLITVFSIQRTYARYFETVGTTYDTKIKRWMINVNNSNIHENESLNEVMTPAIVENNHINSNILVPGGEGYFPFVIDYANVDLAFQFQFNFEQINETPMEDFEIYGFQIIDGETTKNIEILEWTKLDSEIQPITKINPIINPTTGEITYEKITTKEDLTLEGTKEVQQMDDDKKVEIRVLFRWNDFNADTTDTAETAGMNNQEDTQFMGVENGENIHKLLKYNVTITFKQYVEPSEGQV